MTETIANKQTNKTRQNKINYHIQHKQPNQTANKQNNQSSNQSMNQTNKQKIKQTSKQINTKNKPFFFLNNKTKKNEHFKTPLASP
jgi:hypothetical protein